MWILNSTLIKYGWSCWCIVILLSGFPLTNFWLEMIVRFVNLTVTIILFPVWCSYYCKSFIPSLSQTHFVCEPSRHCVAIYTPTHCSVKFVLTRVPSVTYTAHYPCHRVRTVPESPGPSQMWWFCPMSYKDVVFEEGRGSRLPNIMSSIVLFLQSIWPDIL